MYRRKYIVIFMKYSSHKQENFIINETGNYLILITD